MMKQTMLRWLALSSLGVLALLGAVHCGGAHLTVVKDHRAISASCPENPGAGDQCLQDSDCGATGVCSCKGSTFAWAHQSTHNTCVPSNCRTDAACGAGGLCSPTVSFDCGSFYGVQGYYCHTSKDACHNDSDCDAGDACAYSNALGYWACSHGHCAG